jgi:hypothetical protein
MESMRVDPSALSTAAAEMSRLTEAVSASRRGADGRITVLGARSGEVAQSALDQWRQAAPSLDRLESDFRVVSQALAELADYFADLDRSAVPR